MSIRTHQVTVTITTGAAGSASGNGQSTSPVSGRILAVYAGFATTHANTDTTITAPSVPIQTILTLTDVNTAGWYHPRAVVHGVTGAPLTGGEEPLPIDDYIKVAMAQATQGVHNFYFLVES
jgi:hypothetical protein